MTKKEEKTLAEVLDRLADSIDRLERRFEQVDHREKGTDVAFTKVANAVDKMGGAFIDVQEQSRRLDQQRTDIMRKIRNDQKVPGRGK